MSDEKINVDIWHPARINALNFNFSWLGWHKWTKTKEPGGDMEMCYCESVCELKTLVAWHRMDCCVYVFLLLASQCNACTLINDTADKKKTWNNSFVESACTTTTKGNEWWMNSEECNTYINCFLALLLIRRILFALDPCWNILKATKCILSHTQCEEKKIERSFPAWKHLRLTLMEVIKLKNLKVYFQSAS